MKRRTRQVIGLSLMAVATIFLFSWPSLLKFAVQGGLQKARQNGTNLSWNGLSTGFSSVALDSLKVWIPGPRGAYFAIPISVELERISVVLQGASLLVLSPSATFSTYLYGGSITGEAKKGPRVTHLTANLDEIELGRHPQLSSLGVRGGHVNGSFQDFQIAPQGIENGEFALRVRELEVPSVEAATTLLRTNDFGTVDLDVDGVITPAMVDVKNIRLSSLFGSAVGNITASDHLSPFPSIKGSFEVSLSQDGSAALGPWLPFILGAGLDASTSAFVMGISPTSCSTPRGTTAVLRLKPGLCVKLVFTKQ